MPYDGALAPCVCVGRSCHRQRAIPSGRNASQRAWVSAWLSLYPCCDELGHLPRPSEGLFCLFFCLFLGYDGGFLLSLDALLLTRFRLYALFLGTALGIERFLLFQRLLLENIALDVGALTSNFDVDRPRSTLAAGQSQFRLRLALKRDPARRRGRGRRVVLPVAATQMRQQLELGVIADRVIRTLDLDASFVELRKQLLDRHF